LGIGHRVEGLGFRVWGFVAGRVMPDARCPMPDARCPMPDARCQCPMPHAPCPMPVALRPGPPPKPILHSYLLEQTNQPA
jgi:hypothetical protein